MSTEIILLGLVDDHTIFRQTLAHFLNHSGNFQVVLQAGDGADLQAQLHKPPLPHVLLLDLHMPVMDGFETIHWLAGAHPNLPVLILTDRRTDETMVTLIHYGARAILQKNICVSLLQKAIGRVLEEGSYFPDVQSRKLFRSAYCEVEKKQLRKQLFSEREWRLLQLAGSGLTNCQIGALLDVSEANIKKLLHELYQELGVQNRAELAVLAERHGILQPKTGG